MKAILLLAAVYSLIINQAQKKAPVNHNPSRKQTRFPSEQVAEKAQVVNHLQIMETPKDHTGNASLLYGNTLSIFSGSAKR